MKYVSEEEEPRTVVCDDCDGQPVLSRFENGFLVACHSHECDVTAVVASSNLLLGGRWERYDNGESVDFSEISCTSETSEKSTEVICGECGERPHLVTDPYGPIGGYGVYCACDRYVDVDGVLSESELTESVVGSWTQFD
jgi:hypothetical protein